MDLAPPPLTGSPCSPWRKSLDSPRPYNVYNYMSRVPDGSYVHLPSVESACDTPSSFAIIDSALADPALADAFDVGSPFALPEPIPSSSIEWAAPTAVASATSPALSTTSSMPPRLSEYAQFGYDSSGLSPASYPATAAYSRTTSHSPSYMRTPPLRTADADSFSHLFPTRTPLGSTPTVLGGASSSYGHVTDDSSYFSSSSLMPSNGLHMATSHPSTQMLFPDAPQPRATIYSGNQPKGTVHGLATASSSSQLILPPVLCSAHKVNQSWDKTNRKDKSRSRRHTTKEEANFQCTVEGCGKFFSRSYNYKSHMETHDEKREYPFPCQVPDCTRKFVRRTDLQRHHQSVHAKERAHRCDYCGRTFARKDTRRRHMEDGCPNRFDFTQLEATAGLTGQTATRVTHKAGTTTGPGGDLDTFSISLRSPMPLAPAPTPGSLRALSLGRRQPQDWGMAEMMPPTR
ncbi:Zinc finger, C2H2 type [Geosmithia morbida]|uniref:Zinc finger, C2H2 type n=1 Tax=Geosmithia morbida TaxID=1094350 RepID=A0A9P4YRZ5_9HYPO|nr:Zinc finger, C2H2 type [Geosmithia morbida]KAF4120985.1 Zinc finger, C2H2 type [Geosmithia morbida]